MATLPPFFSGSRSSAAKCRSAAVAWSFISFAFVRGDYRAKATRFLLDSATVASASFGKRKKRQSLLSAREAFMTIIVLAAWTDMEKAVDKNR
jgi:hypothetical protein